MKKITLSVIALAAISFASCTKERTCSCTTTYYGGSTEVTVTKARSTKKDAKNWCASNEEATDANNGLYDGLPRTGRSCALK